MKKLGLLLATLALTTLTGLPALSQSPFDGTWKLDVTKSQLTGDTFTYSRTPAGMMHYSDGAFDWDFGIDGKRYPTVSNMTTTWMKVDVNKWNSEGRMGDKVVDTIQRVLSNGDKTMTVTYTAYRPDGKSDTSTTIYNKVGSGKGLEGTWKNVKAKEVPEDTLTLSLNGGKLLLKDLNFQSTVEGQVDGSELQVKGPSVPAGLTIAYKATSDSRLDYTVKMNDKVISVGYMTVSGSTLTDTSWTPGKENEKEASVYNRQ